MSSTLDFKTNARMDRLDKALALHCPNISRSRLHQLIIEGYVTVDGQRTKPSSRLHAGQLVSVTVPNPTPSNLKPQSIPLKVIYEDSDLLVVDKPAGLTVHPAPGNQDHTLANAILAHCPNMDGIEGTLRPGIVHRLDKNTSGLLVVAKNEKTHSHLANQFKHRDVTKSYLGLVYGSIEPPEAIIEAPIGRDPRNRKRMTVITTGRVATTQYSVVNRFKRFTLLEIRTKTGRTHQIRVHMASINHPLVGDVTYGRSHPQLNRHFLHANLLGFEHPSTGQHVQFASPLSSDLQIFLESLWAKTAPHTRQILP